MARIISRRRRNFHNLIFTFNKFRVEEKGDDGIAKEKGIVNEFLKGDMHNRLYKQNNRPIPSLTSSSPPYWK